MREQRSYPTVIVVKHTDLGEADGVFLTIFTLLRVNYAHWQKDLDDQVAKKLVIWNYFGL